MISRNNYVQEILKFRDKPLIKVLTGLRRSGKSCILKLLIEKIKSDNINENQILYYNFESMTLSHIENEKILYEEIRTKLDSGSKYYLFFDEIQEVDKWELAINSFMVDFNVDIYITGSNSKLLSNELSTYLTGRYVEFHVLPLSLSESLDFDSTSNFDHYLKMGGFPVLYTSNFEYEDAYKIVNDIYSSALLRDTIQRFQIRDVDLLDRVIRFIFDNIGSIFSANSIANYIKSQNRKLDVNTIYSYLSALESAFIIYKAPRYDIKGKEVFKTQEKYFVGDIAFIYAKLGFRESQISGILENLVYLELIRKKYTVYIGQINANEVDFVAINKNNKIYIQVAYKTDLDSTLERELKPLKSIKDNCPKYLVTMNDIWQDNFEGIKHLHISDFLKLENYH